MGKLIVLLCSLVMVFGLVGSASALPMTWTETLDWDPDPMLTDGEGLSEFADGFAYYHDIRNDGFVGLFMGGNDVVFSYELQVRLYDDDSDGEGATIFQLPFIIEANARTTYDFTLSDVLIGFTFSGLLDVNHDGTLNIWIEPESGDFFLDWSTITAYGDNGTPVPGPATILLLGSGLVGLAGFGRKRPGNVTK